jgi:hypothetical protein
MNISDNISISCCVNYNELRHLLNVVNTAQNMVVMFKYGNWNRLFQASDKHKLCQKLFQ